MNYTKALWHQGLVKQLIETYKEHQNLYDVRNPAYKDPKKRLKSLLLICNNLKQYNPNITIDDIRKKMHTLRAQLAKEIRRVELSKKNGDDPEDVYVPKLWSFHDLMFLKPFCAKRTLTLNSFDEGNSESNTSSYVRNSKSNISDVRNSESKSSEIKSESNLSHVKKSQSNISGVRESESNISDVRESESNIYDARELESNVSDGRESESNISEFDESGSSSAFEDDDDDPLAVECEEEFKPPTNKRKETFNLEGRKDNVKKLILSKPQQKSSYDWLGEQVVFQISRLKNERIRQDAIWAIQKVLRKASVEDANSYSHLRSSSPSP